MLDVEYGGLSILAAFVPDVAVRVREAVEVIVLRVVQSVLKRYRELIEVLSLPVEGRVYLYVNL